MSRATRLLAAALAAAAVGLAPGPARATLSEGAPAPALQVSTTDGGTCDLGRWRGQVVVLDFWATWCAPCRAAMPRLQELHRKYARRGLRVLGVSLGEGRDRPAVYARSNGLTYAVGWTEVGPARAISRRFDFSGIPVVYILDRRGVVRFAETGFPATPREQKERAARMESAVRALLAAR